jgi:hypothetical protein
MSTISGTGGRPHRAKCLNVRCFSTDPWRLESGLGARLLLILRIAQSPARGALSLIAPENPQRSRLATSMDLHRIF